MTVASRTVSFRVSDELYTWLEEYAQRRGSTKTLVVEAALKAFQEDAKSGVPDLRLAIHQQTQPREDGPAPSREDFKESTALRAELFAGLRTPPSIKAWGKGGAA